MESAKPENELTSTMGNLITANKDEKSDASDSTPTSSTDASTTTSIQSIVTDDTISSTSSEVVPHKKKIEATSPITISDTSCIVSEKDLIAMNITDTSTEKITEDVEDIVQDLENLLGEPSIDYALKPKAVKLSDDMLTDSPANIEEYSKELERLDAKCFQVAQEKADATPVEEVKSRVEPEVQEISELIIQGNIQQIEKAEISESENIQQIEKDEMSKSENIQQVEKAEISVCAIEELPELPKKEEETNETSKVDIQQQEEAVIEELPEEKPEEQANIESAPQETQPIEIQETTQIISEEIKDAPMEVTEISESSEQISDVIPNKLEVDSTEVEKIDEPADIILEKETEPVTDSMEIVPEIINEPKDESMEVETVETLTESGPNEMEVEPIIVDKLVESTEEPAEVETIPESALNEMEVEPVSEERLVPIVEEPEEVQQPVTQEAGSTEIMEAEPLQVTEQPIIEASEIIDELPESSSEIPIIEESIEPEVVQPFEPPEKEIPEESTPVSEVIPEQEVTPNESIQLAESLPVQDDNQEIIDAVLSLENTEPVQSLEDINTIEPEVTPIVEAVPEPDENQDPPDTYVEPPVKLEPPATITEDQQMKELPSEDDIFTESSTTLEQPITELQDENFETLLAIASLQPDSNFEVQDTDKLEAVLTSVAQQVQAEQNKEQQLVAEEIQRVDNAEVVAQAQMIKEEEVVQAQVIKESETIPQPLVVEEPIKSTESKESSSSESSEEEQEKQKLKEPLVINIDDTEKEKAYSPKITIKPIKPSEEELAALSSEHDEKESKGSLKMTITKQDNTMHSILKIYDPEQDQQQENVPKLIIKPIVQPSDQPQSPKVSTRGSKVFSPSSSGSQRSSSPRITIKPIVKPENNESVSPLKITIKPVLKPEERQKHSPKLTIKPIVKPEDESHVDAKVHSPRVTIKPIVKPPEEEQQSPNPRITIKPIPKPEDVATTPRVTIKPVVKPHEEEEKLQSSPKITIKPIPKPQETERHIEEEEQNKGRIVLKINKGNIPVSGKEEKSEKLAKIKLKFSKEGGHPHIVQDDSSSAKRNSDQTDLERTSKRMKNDDNCQLPSSPSHSKLKEMLSVSKSSGDRIIIDDDEDDVRIIENVNKQSPIIISEDSNQENSSQEADKIDPLADVPVFEITPDSVKSLNTQPVVEIIPVVTPPAPRKRGRPRKVPLQVREDFKETKDEEPKPAVYESTRPKRSCRGQSVRTTLGIKPRKPRGPGRGRGGKRGMGTRGAPIMISSPETRETTPPPTPPKTAKEPRLSTAKLKQQMKEELLAAAANEVIDVDEIVSKSPGVSALGPPHGADTSTADRADIVMYEEETRMSAETNSRAQTPAKQVVTSIPTVDLIDESQSSVQSSATTESAKVRKGPRLEVHQEPEGAVISADQLAEYYWNGSGPYMLQEQVAQFLGIKSFKRKYPNISRRVVDMQERDFIRESGLAGEAMCDLGLTAVNSADILDIMYSDFQDKYEEYCKHQRDRQAKDLTNKQKALTLAASQEKTKMDITQQAVQSAASWNANFNKTRRDQRKACMDLQTLTVHYPKGKMKQINKPKIGNYPVAVVPGQYVDYYQEFTPTEINNLPLNTLCYDSVIKAHHEMDVDSQTDGSGSESESTSSDSDSSFSGSSDGEDCTVCNKTNLKRVAAAQ